MSSRILPAFLVLLLISGVGLFYLLRGDSSAGVGTTTVAPMRAAGSKGAEIESRLEGGLAAPELPSADQRAAVAATVAPSASQPPKAADLGYRLLGRVLDAHGAPVSGAQVAASNNQELSLDLALPEELSFGGAVRTSTDKEGRFKLIGLNPGQVRLEVRASGYAPLERRGLSAPSGVQHDLGDFELGLGALLSGYVVDASGAPVLGAKLVDLQAERGNQFGFSGRNLRRPLAVSDSSGYFRIECLACGPWNIEVQSEAYPSRSFEGLADRPGVELSNLRFQLEPAASIAGRVSGLPAEAKDKGAFVQAWPAEPEGSGLRLGFGPALGNARRAELAADGSFELRGLRPDQDYLLSARQAARPGEGFFGQVGGRSGSDTVQARAGARGVDIAWQPEAAISFQVVDAKTGRALEQFRVSFGTRWAQPLRGEDGRDLLEHPAGKVRLGNLRPRAGEQTRVELRAAGYADYKRADVDLLPGQELDLGVIQLEPVPVVRITVVDQSTGAPVAGANVRLTLQEPRRLPRPDGELSGFAIEVEDGEVVQPGRSRQATTDEQGVALLSSFEGQVCDLRVTHEDYATALAKGLSLPSGAGFEHELRLSRGGSVLARVTNPSGQPLAGVILEHAEPGATSNAGRFSLGGGRAGQSGEQAAVTDAAGEYLFGRLAPGEHRFRVAPRAGPGGFVAILDLEQQAEDPNSMDGWQRVAVSEGETATFTLVVEPGASLSGRIREAGLALAGATLKLQAVSSSQGEQEIVMGMSGGGFDMGGDPRATTDGEGRYHFEDVEPGSYALLIEHSARALPARFELELETGAETFDVNLTVSILEGRITDTSGKPIVGARVSAEPYREGPQNSSMVMMIAVDDGGDESVQIGSGPQLGSATTDNQGNYELRGVTPDIDLVVKAEHDDAQPGRSEVVSVGPDQVRRNVDFTLQPGGNLSVRAQDAEGKPRGMLLVTARNLDVPDAAPKTTFLGRTGRGRFSGLTPGHWEIRAQGMGAPGVDGSELPAQNAVVVAGETAEVTIELP